MAKKTGTIRYNVTDRGRQHRGKDRKFDLRALTALINSPEIQERVKNRDMVGYYGHWQRMKFGLTPPEWALVGDKQVNIEPAIVTTFLKAEADGTIEHETEFLDTPSGKIAQRLHDSRTGGFSSAIHAMPRGAVDVPTLFAGFDYVLEPNFTANRGYAFDSIQTGDALFDSVIQELSLSNKAMNVLYDSLQSDHLLAIQTMERLREENEELLSMLARGDTGALVLDSAGNRPLIVSTGPARKFQRAVDSFRSAHLVGFEKPVQEAGAPDATTDMINKHYGVR
jgi:hypothetical protein